MERSTKVRIATMPLFAIAVASFVIVLFIHDTEYFQPIRVPVLVGIIWVSFVSLVLLILSGNMRREEAMRRDS